MFVVYKVLIIVKYNRRNYPLQQCCRKFRKLTFLPDESGYTSGMLMMTSVALEERQGCVGYKLDQGLSLSVILDVLDKIENASRLDQAVDLFYSKFHLRR